MSDPDPIPITLLTGFLGAGKTTLVNHILTQSHGRRTAVIVNDFGDLGIDAALIRNDNGSVIELANGCLCCSTRGEFAKSVQELLTTPAEIENVLVETSGLVDPEPVICDLERFRFARQTRLDGVITVIDAENFDRNLNSAEAAFRQIVYGDILLINKADLVESETPRLIEAGLRRLNPYARILVTSGCDAPLTVLLGPARITRSRLPLEDHHAHDGFVSISLTFAAPLDRTKFASWLEQLPVTVYRVKGFVRFADDKPFVLHCVGGRRSVESAPANVAVSGATLVVIGRNIEESQLRSRLEACAA